mgnify:FL=1
MKNYLRIIFSSLLLIWATPSQAEFNVGLGVIAGIVSSDGTETEGTATDTSNRSKSFDEAFAGADIFAEFVSDGGYALGVSYVPINQDVGDGKRTDTGINDDDTGTRSASAELVDMYSIYANVPFGSEGWYGLLSYTEVTVETKETLNVSTYGNAEIDGYSVGLGKKSGPLKYELYYTDFDDINLTATTDADSSNSIAADIDSVTFRISYGF